MCFEFDHELGALRLDDARPVLDLGRDGQLPARLDPLQQHRVQERARGIDGGGVARRAGTDDQDAGGTGVGHVRYLA